MSKKGLDASFESQVFRRDFPMILASRRDLASIKSVRLELTAGDTAPFKAGQVLAYDSSSKTYKKYGAVSGSLDASCILFENVDAPASGSTVLERGVFGGEVYKSALIDYEAGVLTDLGGRIITDSDETEILKF